MVNRYLEALLTLLIACSVVFALGCQGSSTAKKSDDQNSSAMQNDQNAPANEVSSDNGSGTGAAKIFFPEVDHDFGNVNRDATLTYTFKVFNKGDAPLQIIKAKGS